MRLATNSAAIQHAKQEAAIYERLEHLQGQCIPRLLAHGLTLEGGAYFVATEYIEVGLVMLIMYTLLAITQLSHVWQSMDCSHDSSQACICSGMAPACR